MVQFVYVQSGLLYYSIACKAMWMVILLLIQLFIVMYVLRFQPPMCISGIIYCKTLTIIIKSYLYWKIFIVWRKSLHYNTSTVLLCLVIYVSLNYSEMTFLYHIFFQI